MTEATDKGFVVGKHYRATSVYGEDGTFRIGETLKFVEDDGSPYPYFERYDPVRCCPYLTNLSNIAVEDEPATKSNPNLRVELDKYDSAIKITLAGNFTEEQVADILKTVYA
jgi:hypothetical protein